jgi:hypothetical protein
MMLVNNVIAAYANCDNATHLAKLITEDSIPFSMSNPLKPILHRLDPTLKTPRPPSTMPPRAETPIALLKTAMDRLLSKFSSPDAVAAPSSARIAPAHKANIQGEPSPGMAMSTSVPSLLAQREQVQI